MIYSFGQTVSTSCIDIPIRRDTELEDDEHFTVIVASEDSTPSVTTVTIVDDKGEYISYKIHVLVALCTIKQSLAIEGTIISLLCLTIVNIICLMHSAHH